MKSDILTESYKLEKAHLTQERIDLTKRWNFCEATIDQQILTGRDNRRQKIYNQRMNKFSLLRSVCIFWALLWLTTNPALSQDQSQIPDFERDVLPIFKQHCFECHGNGNREGNLSLESLATIQQGGHTGNRLLSQQLEDSELHLRIVSSSDGFRMPKDGPPLSADQVATINKWIPAAAKLPHAQPNHQRQKSGTPAAQPQPDRATTDPQDAAPPSQATYILLASAAAIALASIWLTIRFLGKRRKKISEKPIESQLAISNRSWWLLAIPSLLMICLLAATTIHFFRQTQQLTENNRKLENKLLKTRQPDGVAPILVNATNLPLPPHPMHPKRLGGRYYRGNDERHEHLFNGGFYRTATIDLHLVDAQGTRKQWNDRADEELFIEIEIQRANQATKELFSPRVHQSIHIQHFCQTSTESSGDFKFEEVKPFDLWRCRIPLAAIELWSGDSESSQLRGLIYIMYGSQIGVENRRPHFAIRYQLDLAENTISPSSELWMGSLFTLAGRVLVPHKGEVLLDRWFDWRPIPEIQGQGSTDPRLLGLPEHLE